MSYFNIENFVKFNNIANSVNHLKEALRKKLRYYDKDRSLIIHFYPTVSNEIYIWTFK